MEIQEDAAWTLAQDLRSQIEQLQARLREAETHLEPFAITRNTITAVADRIPARAPSPDLPHPPDCPCILAVFNNA
ncbi:hypothetical protein [Streptomyces sp. ME18-1-4]|uniref:hypothetical protein n=1 Tax=Streptomyces sp. ME18-1-4 TaxID=3028685 RepID=UPI0029A57C85|nr:hypothetical protein [Streptomyces sp. ME18-1-4]MDX3248013.1 hypothetical protein [Streptomyces sp. ME18-1-4]